MPTWKNMVEPRPDLSKVSTATLARLIDELTARTDGALDHPATEGRRAVLAQMREEMRRRERAESADRREEQAFVAYQDASVADHWGIDS